MSDYKVISTQAIKEINPNEGIILDVRTPMEHAEKHIAIGHVHMPLDVLDPMEFMMRHGLDKDASVYILCRSGTRAKKAAEIFVQSGFKNVFVIDGGVLACESNGFDLKGHGVKKERAGCASSVKGPLSLERQVRIAAGLFVFLGAVLALTIDPLFVFIPLFVGCGLIFAGVTDRCGLALVLTKAPWNKIEMNQTCSLREKEQKAGGCE